MQTATERDKINNTIQKLFFYMGEKQWDTLMSDVFTELIELDLTSVGGETERRTAESFCEELDYQFREIDSLIFVLGPVVIEQLDHEALVLLTASTIQFKESAKKGKIREYHGSYKIKLSREENSWLVTQFRFELKFESGNTDLR